MAEEKGGGIGLLLLGGVAALAYFTRESWLPTIEAEFPSLFGSATGATGNNPTAPTVSTGNQPISATVPGATPIGTQGCYSYPTGTSGSTVINCPPGVTPPTANTPAVSCASGFSLDAAGVCTMYPDNYLLANLNTIPWTGLTDIPAEQIQRIDPAILADYSTTTGVNAGTVLAYMLGLGANPANGTMATGSDGNAYQALNGVFYRQGTATTTSAGSLQGVRLGATPQTPLASALPMTPSILIMASANPMTAQLVGRDPRAMLTADQWNGYYTMATGIVQGIPIHPEGMQGSLMSAEQYQARRRHLGLETTTNLGTLRPARRGAFPLGGLGSVLRAVQASHITQWTPPGNRTIFQIPGRGATPAASGKIPPRGARIGLIQDGGGNHRWARSPFPRPSWWRESE